MKPILKITLLLLLPFFAKSQTQEKQADNLRQALGMATADSTKYDIAGKLAESYYQTNADSALLYLRKELLISEKNKMMLDVAEDLSRIGYQLTKLSKYGDALKCFLRAVKIAEDSASEGKVFKPGNNPDPRNKRIQVLATMHIHWGNLLGEISDTSGQVFHYLEAKKIYKESGNDELALGVNMNLGGVYTELGKLDSAMQLEQLLLENTNKRGGYGKYTGVVYWRIGNIYQKMGDKRQTVENWYKGIAFSIERHQINLARIYGSLASFYLDEKNNDSSLYYAKKQLHLVQSMESKNPEAAYTNLFKSYELNGNKDSAYVYKGLALEATEKTFKEKIKNLGDFQKEAFKEQERLQQLEEEKIESKNKLRNYALLVVLGVFLLIGFFLYRNNRQKQKANKVLKEQKDKVESTLHELKSTQSQLIQSEKMASLGELTAGIAHEIQNPLNFVNNFSEVSNELMDEMKTEFKKGDTEEGFAIADDIKQNLEKILHHGKRADAIVKGMLQHSSSSSGKKEPTDINTLADEYLRLSYHGLKAKDKSFNATLIPIAIGTDFDESIGNINIIPQDIGRVILNLITNAFYVVNEKSKQNIAGYEPTVEVNTKKEGNKILISVKDNGNGIPQKILDKIFQPFFTTKPTGQGTGLGLSLSYDIIKSHGGEIKVDTKEGEGSEFIIQLPIV